MKASREELAALTAAEREARAAREAERLADLQQEAARSERSVRDVVLERARRLYAQRGAGLPAAVWAGMHVTTRQLLLTVATDRAHPELDARRPWHDFTASEQAAVGALARQLRRDLVRAEWLR